MAKLLYLVEQVVVREYPLKAGELTIGRRSNNQIQVDDSAVSGLHAALKVTPSAYLEGQLDVWVEDRGSTNGTKVNGRAVSRHRLKDGDILEIATHRFKFVADPAAQAGTTRLLLRDEG